MNELHRYFARRLPHLQRVAKRYTQYPDDVIHDTYIKAIEAGFAYVNDRLTDVYFVRGIKRNAITKEPSHQELTNEIAEIPDMAKIVSREKLDEAVRLLPEFDRLLFELYIRGVNMRRLSKDTQISINTINHSLKRSKEAIKGRL